MFPLRFLSLHYFLHFRISYPNIVYHLESLWSSIPLYIYVTLHCFYYYITLCLLHTLSQPISLLSHDVIQLTPFLSNFSKDLHSFVPLSFLKILSTLFYIHILNPCNLGNTGMDNSHVLKFTWLCLRVNSCTMARVLLLSLIHI